MTLDIEAIQHASRNLMVCGFAIALLASAWARNWGYVAFSLLALIESCVGMRFPFHAWVRDALLGSPFQLEAKTALQTRLLQIVFGVGGVALLAVIIAGSRSSHGRRLVLAGTLLIAVMLALELISPHYIDAMLIHPVGPFARAAVAYFVGALAIAAGVMMQRRWPDAAAGSAG
jgi:hypothetical protein